jgi:hypothetical protein
VKPRSGDVAGANLNQGRRAGSVQPSEVEPDPDLALNANKRAVESTCSFRVSRNEQYKYDTDVVASWRKCSHTELAANID